MALTEEQMRLLDKAKAALNKASRLYGVNVSKTTVVAGVLLNIPLPDRIGGHDTDRGKEGGTQKGGGASSSEHGVNQANQWLLYKSSVLSRLQEPTKRASIVAQAKLTLKHLIQQEKLQASTIQKSDPTKHELIDLPEKKRVEIVELKRQEQKKRTAEKKKAAWESRSKQIEATKENIGIEENILKKLADMNKKDFAQFTKNSSLVLTVADQHKISKLSKKKKSAGKFR